MNNLQQDFLERSVANLENLVEQLKQGNDGRAFSETLGARECFRVLHTVKGTAQTFGFTQASRLAHALENLLAAAKTELKDEERKSLLLEGLSYLTETFKRKDFKVSDDFLNRINSNSPPASPTEDSQINSSEIPHEIFSRLSSAEKSALASALQNERGVYCLEIIFDLATFANEFAAFRQALSEKSEIIAMFPAVNSNGGASGKIGFRILLATAEDIKTIAEENSAEIVFQTARMSFTNDLNGVFAQIAAHGKALAEQLGKQIEFKIAIESEPVPPETLRTIFDALLHLVRNAIDHAIETSEERLAKNKSARGEIKISFTSDESNFYLTVSDDGRGIDWERIKTKATEKNLIPSGADLTEKAALDLIFLPDFSTRDRLTEISGRGVGLDVVKTMLEKNGGKITVESRVNFGTAFEIVLPAGSEPEKLD